MRRMTWLIMAPVMLGVAYIGAMVISGFFHLIGFGYVDGLEMRILLSKVVGFSAIGMAALAGLVGVLLRRRKKSSESGLILFEASSLCIAISFGAAFVYVHVQHLSLGYLVWVMPFLAWLAFIEMRKPQKSRRRSWFRAAGLCLLAFLVALIINYAAS